MEISCHGSYCVSIFTDSGMFMDLNGIVGFKTLDVPFTPITPVISDCPISFISNESRRKRDVSQRASSGRAHRKKRETIVYDVSACDTAFSSSSLTT